MQKGQILIWIIVGILLIAIAGGAYYLGRSTSPKQSTTPTVAPPTTQPSPSDASPAPTGAGETANWKTLEGPHSTIQQTPYSLQYQETWISEKDVINDPSRNYLFFETGKLLITKNLQLSDSNPQTVLKGAYIYTFGQSNIFESSKSFDQNLAEFDLGLSKSASPKPNIIKEERFLLDGQPARKRVKKLANEGYVEVVFEYPKNAGYMYLELVSSLNEFEAEQKIFDQILSTFKFL